MFTLIAYISDGSDSCRGCYMGGWSSKYGLFIGLNAQELRNKLVELKTEKYYDNRDDGYEFAVLASIDGKIYRVYGDLDYHQNGSYDEEGYETYWETIDKLETEVGNIFKDVDEMIKDKKVQEARQKEIEKAAAVERARDRQKQQELAQLAELKAKYEGRIS